MFEFFYHRLYLATGKYMLLSGETSKNKFKILLTKDSVYTEHKKYKVNFLRNNVNQMPNVYTKNMAYEEIFISSNYLFVCSLHRHTKKMGGTFN